jgi:hypothetical protein
MLFLPTAILALVSALVITPAIPAHTASAPHVRILGGLPDIPSYCKAKGFEDSSDPVSVETVGDWECVSSERSMPITNDPKSLRNLTWDEACDLFYGVKFGNTRPINTAPTDPPFTVKCVK